MAFVVAPILEGKLDTWKAWIADCNGARREGLKDMNQGNTRHGRHPAASRPDAEAVSRQRLLGAAHAGLDGAGALETRVSI